MSAAPRLAARATLAGVNYWFNFFRCEQNLFLYFFYTMYGLQFCIFYNLRARSELVFRSEEQLNANAVSTVLSSQLESN
jgi:hypothetical protein